MRIPKKLSFFPISSYSHLSFSFPRFDFPRTLSLLSADSRRLFIGKRKDFHSSGVSHLHASYSMEESRTTALTERMMDDSYMGGYHYVPKPNVWSSQDGGQKIEIGRQIFCNRSLNMRNIVAVGFDMDYTLAQYKPETFESLAYEGTIKKLVYDLGYPNELLEWSFDWKYMVRGLVLDKKRGNILKMDRHKYVKIAYHGFKELSKEEKVGTYGYTLVRDSFDEPDYALIDTLFSLAEAYLFAQLVDFMDKNPGKVSTGIDYARMYRDVRAAVDLCHRDGTLKQMVAKDPGRYINEDTSIVPMLKMLIDSKRSTFLVTNSLWDYTNIVMNYLCGPYSPSGKSSSSFDWLQYFDVVITGSAKPGFFHEDNRANLFEVERETGMLINTDNGSPTVQVGNILPRLSLKGLNKTCRTFQGGNVAHLHKLLSIESSSQVLYVGDHIYGDILRSKKVLGWRTMLVVPELEREVDLLWEVRDSRKQLRLLRNERDKIEDQIHRLKWPLKFDDISPDEKQRLCVVIKELESKRDEVRLSHQQAQRKIHHKFHKVWGQLMKTGYQNSRFAHQMGGIDEAALDRLSLVTQMTKHIRVRASGGKATASELGQFSPIFVWLLRDFYLDLVEDNKKITPRDYLELTLRPVQGSKRDIAAKNEIRDSICALFPDRECFTLVRPLNNENDLQKLDQILLDRLRPEFRSGLDALTKFVFERTRPKQVGATILTGPILVGITSSYLDALNNGAVPTISSSWQSVEEAECRRAYDSATEVYKTSFDRSKPPEEAALREAHEEAMKRSLDAFNAGAVGTGLARKKQEELLHKFFRRSFEDYKRSAFMEADLQCSVAIQSMEKRLRAACHSNDASIDNVVKVLDALLSEYEASSFGPVKWQKLAVFLQHSLEGPILDLAKRLMDRIGSEKSSLVLKCRSIEDTMGLLTKKLEATENNISQYQKRYEDAINDKKKLSDEYANRIAKLQSNCSLLEERSSGLLRALESAKQEASDWKRKYDYALSQQKAEEDQANSEIGILKSRTSAAEARLAAAKEQAQSAEEEADEWKRKYDIAIREAKAALEKAAVAQERTNKESQLREDALRAEFSNDLAAKDEEMKEKVEKIVYAEQCMMTLKSELKAAQSKIENYNVEIMSMKDEIRGLSEKLETANAKAQSFERESKIVEQEKLHLEQKYMSEFKRFEEVQERCRSAEKEARRATEMADRARADAITAQKDKSEIQKLAMERLAQIERAERHIESLDRDQSSLGEQLKESRLSLSEAVSKVAILEARVEEREKEIESLLDSNNETRASTVQVLESLLETERKARAEANNRAEDLSVKLQSAQSKIDSLQHKLTSVLLNETALDSKLKTASLGKRIRADDGEFGVESVQDMDIDRAYARDKKSRRAISPLGYGHSESGGSLLYRNDEDNNSHKTNQEDYTKFTVQKLKQELTKHNFGAELLQLEKPSKKEILSLYERLVLLKP